MYRSFLILDHNIPSNGILPKKHTSCIVRVCEL